MGKMHSSMVVLRIQPKFGWMIPMGVGDHHIKYEPHTQQWRPGTMPALYFGIFDLQAKSAFLFAQNHVRTC